MNPSSPPQNYKYRTPASIPGLSDSEQVRLKHELASITKRHLRPHTPYHLQDRHALDALFEDCRASMPFLCRYPELWPIRTILKARLRRRPCMDGRSSRKGVIQSENLRERESRTSVESPPCSDQLPSLGSLTQTVCVTAHTMSHQEKPCRRPPVSIASRPLSEQSFHQDHHPQTSREPPSKRTPGSNTAVRGFLNSLIPTLAHFTTSFVRNGIENEQCLDGLAGLPTDYQTTFLSSSLGLNSFQVLCVQAALRKWHAREIIYID